MVLSGAHIKKCKNITFYLVKWSNLGEFETFQNQKFDPKKGFLWKNNIKISF